MTIDRKPFDIWRAWQYYFLGVCELLNIQIIIFKLAFISRVTKQNLGKKFPHFPWFFPWPEHKLPWTFSAFCRKFYLEHETIIVAFFRWKITTIFNLMIISIFKFPSFPQHFGETKTSLIFPDYFIFPSFPSFSRLVGTLIRDIPLNFGGEAGILITWPYSTPRFFFFFTLDWPPYKFSGISLI